MAENAIVETNTRAIIFTDVNRMFNISEIVDHYYPIPVREELDADSLAECVHAYLYDELVSPSKDQLAFDQAASAILEALPR